MDRVNLSQVVRVQFFKIMIEVDELDEILAKESCGGESHQNLILSSIRRDLSNLDEPPPLVFLHIQVKPLALQNQSARCQVTLRTEVFVRSEEWSMLIQQLIA